MTSNVEIAYEATYRFKSWQVGVCFVSALVGSLAGIPLGGWWGDKVADYFTKRNNGIRDPEMRLPAMIPAMITAPLGLVIFGVGIEKGLHWMVPNLGIALCKFFCRNTQEEEVLTWKGNSEFCYCSGNECGAGVCH